MLYKASAWEEDKKKIWLCCGMLSCNAAFPLTGITMLLSLCQNLVSFSTLRCVNDTEMSLSELCSVFLHIITKSEFLLKESYQRSQVLHYWLHLSVKCSDSSLVDQMVASLSPPFCCVDNLQNLKDTQATQMSSSFWQLRDNDSRNLTVQQCIANSAVSRLREDCFVHLVVCCQESDAVLTSQDR